MKIIHKWMLSQNFHVYCFQLLFWLLTSTTTIKITTRLRGALWIVKPRKARCTPVRHSSATLPPPPPPAFCHGCTFLPQCRWKCYSRRTSQPGFLPLFGILQLQQGEGACLAMRMTRRRECTACKTDLNMCRFSFFDFHQTPPDSPTTRKQTCNRL